jgi:hypothetical protein
MSKFAIVHNLDQLSEAQRQQYLRDASTFLGLDPDLNGLDLIWLNTEEGIRRLTAYARRGTTDILRKIHGISVTSLTQHDGPGYVSFTATGKDPSGRNEIAVGASFLDGLKGDRVAAAVATAQTRALRRLTLQFVGLAVLDESEVNLPVSQADQQKANARLDGLALAPAASVAPSSEPGKDVTLKPDPSGVAEFIVKQELKGWDGPAPTTETQEQFEARQAKLRADAINTLNQNPPKEGVSLQSIAEPKKIRKPRGPNKAKVDLGPSEPVPVSAKDGIPESQRTATAVVPLPEKLNALCSPGALNASQGTLSMVVVTEAARATAVAFPARLTPDQVKPFRQRLFKIVNDHLEPNGFTPKEGMGNADKMRAFAQVMFSDVQNLNELSVENWEKYLTVLENKIKTEGPAATVKFIEDAIGI